MTVVCSAWPWNHQLLQKDNLVGTDFDPVDSPVFGQSKGPKRILYCSLELIEKNTSFLQVVENKSQKHKNDWSENTSLSTFRTNTPLPPSNPLWPRWAPWHGWPLPQLQRAKCWNPAALNDSGAIIYTPGARPQGAAIGAIKSLATKKWSKLKTGELLV